MSQAQAHNAAGRQVAAGLIILELVRKNCTRVQGFAVNRSKQRYRSFAMLFQRGEPKMIERRMTVRMGLLTSLFLTVGWISQPHAAISVTLDDLPDGVAGVSVNPAEMGGIRPLTGQKRVAGQLPPDGNPLWSVPLSNLTATQQRPIFSASRRPPPPPVAAIPPRINLPKAVVVEQPPERPPLAMIGAVVGDADAIAVFLDQSTSKIVRLRQGQAHAGWVLSSILRREVTFKKADQTEILALQGTNGAVGHPGPVIPGLPVQSTQAPAPAPASVLSLYAPYLIKPRP